MSIAVEPRTSTPTREPSEAETAIPTPEDAPLTARRIAHEDLSDARKNVIMVSVVGTQLVQLVAFGGGVLAGRVVPAALGETSQAANAWVAASYPLTQGAFILPGGRLGAVFGHHRILFVGAVLWVAFSLGSAFSPNFIAFCILRAFSGVGGGIMVPNAIALLCITFPPGPKRNLALGMFGAAAPVGAAGGSIICGVIFQFAAWKWVFIFLALLGLVVFGIAFIATPPDAPLAPDGQIDIVGSVLGVSALFLFNFVWNQAPVVGWPTPYEYILLIVSILCAATFVFWEARIAKEPVLPLSIWTRPSFGAIVAVVCLSLMGFGVFLWYLFLWNTNLRGYSLTATGASVAPFILTAGTMAVISAMLVSRVRVEIIMALGVCSIGIANILLATMPVQETYWAQVFPAIVIAGAGPDLLLTAAQVIASNAVRRAEQGVAGSLIGVVNTYALSTGLGFAGTVETYVNDHGRNVVKGYRGALYLGIGFCVLGLALNLLFVRMPADTKRGWDEDDLKEREVASTMVEEKTSNGV
ncbi:MFS general substrate transporter [Trametes sanguinea]|nr:MFS general substrate transporter [Trametes sanguinea]